MRQIFCFKIGLIYLCTAFLVVAHLSEQTVFADKKPPTQTVIYGGSNWLGHYPVWVGMKKGLFRDKGLAVVFQQFYASSSRMGAMLAGNIDFASTGAISGIALMAAGVQSFYAIGTQDSYATVEGIIVKPHIDSVAALKNKKIAVTFASSAHVLVLDALEKNGLDPTGDVKLINLKVSEMPAAFQSGEVDACALWTPMFNKVLAMENAKLLLDDRSFSLYQQYQIGPGPDLLVARRDFVQKNPETVNRFLEAYFESVDMLTKEPTICADLLLDLTRLTREQQLAVLKDITWYDLQKQHELMKDPGRFVEGLQKLANFLQRHEQIDGSPEIRKWVNTAILP